MINIIHWNDLFRKQQTSIHCTTLFRRHDCIDILQNEPRSGFWISVFIFTFSKCVASAMVVIHLRSMLWFCWLNGGQQKQCLPTLWTIGSITHIPCWVAVWPNLSNKNICKWYNSWQTKLLIPCVGKWCYAQVGAHE